MPQDPAEYRVNLLVCWAVEILVYVLYVYFPLRIFIIFLLCKLLKLHANDHNYFKNPAEGI